MASHDSVYIDMTPYDTPFENYDKGVSVQYN
jgi:hypothetical protein